MKIKRILICCLFFYISNALFAQEKQKTDTIISYYPNGNIKSNYLVLFIDTVQLYESIEDDIFYDFCYNVIIGSRYFQNGNIEHKYSYNKSDSIQVIKSYNIGGILIEEEYKKFGKRIKEIKYYPLPIKR